MHRIALTLLVIASIVLAHAMNLHGVAIGVAAADGVFKYTDRDGKTHYITDTEKVPEEYRSQVSVKADLPEISKTEAGKVQRSATGVGSPSRPAPAKGPAYLGSAKVELFVTAWCPYCRSVEELLKERRVHYKKYDIETSAKGKKIHESLGGGGVPVTRIGSQVIHGYDADQILAALKIR